MLKSYTKTVPDYEKANRLFDELDFLEAKLELVEKNIKKLDLKISSPDLEDEEDKKKKEKTPLENQETALKNKIKRINQMLNPFPTKTESGVEDDGMDNDGDADEPDQPEDALDDPKAHQNDQHEASAVQDIEINNADVTTPEATDKNHGAIYLPKELEEYQATMEETLTHIAPDTPDHDQDIAHITSQLALEAFANNFTDNVLDTKLSQDLSKNYRLKFSLN